MNAKEITVVMARLLDAYPNAKLRDGTPDLYAEMLEDLDFTTAMRTVTKIITESESDFFPTIAAFRRAAGLGVTDEDVAQLNEQRKIARGTINVFGIEAARGIIGTERFDRLFPEHVPQPQTALEAAIERELHPRSELGAGE